MSTREKPAASSAVRTESGRGRRRTLREKRGPGPEPASAWIKPAMVLVLVTLLVYLPSLRSGFVWDDDLHVTENLITRPDGLYQTWFTTHQPNYWPITWSAFWLEWRMFGMRPTGYHLVNMLVHALNVVLLWRVLFQLAIPGAWAAALVFAIHPVNAEAVAWITQLKTLLSMGFYLGSLLCYFRYQREEELRWYAAAAALFVLGLLSKPAIVMLPVVLLLCDWWRHGRLGVRDLLRTAPFFGLALAMSLTEIWFQYNRSMSGVVVRTDGFASRLAGAGWVVWFYLRKAVAPVGLNFVYPRWDIPAASPLAYLPGVSLVGLAALAWWKRAGWGRPVFFALAYFTVTLFPVLGFFNIFYMRYSFVADHWQHVAIVAPIALVVGFGAWLVSRGPVERRAPVIAGGVAAAMVLVYLTVMHQAMFRDVETLYRETIRRNDRAVLAHANLASFLYKKHHADPAKGHLDEAITTYEKALALDPHDPESHAGLGNALFDKGRFEEALTHYQAALPLMPEANRFKVHFEMAETYARLGRKGEAIAQFEEVLRLRPNIARAHQRIAELRER